MNTTNSLKPFFDVFKAAMLWHVWLRVGLQDLRTRYRGSAIGIGWIFLNIAVLVTSIGIIYSKLLGQELKDFLPFLTIGLIQWGYITASVVEGGNAFVNSEGYIKQIGLPLYVYVFKYFVSITATMLINLPAFFLIALISSMKFSGGALWALLGLLMLCVVSFLVIAIFSHLNARFRDTAHIAGIGLQVMFFVTPVIWPPEMIRSRGLSWVLDFNPLYHLIEIVRHPLLSSNGADWLNYVVVVGLIFLLTIIAASFTRRYYRRIAYFL